MARDPSTVRAAVRWLAKAVFLVEAGVESRFGGRSRLFELPCLDSLFVTERAKKLDDAEKDSNANGGNSPLTQHRKHNEEHGDGKQSDAAAAEAPPREEAEATAELVSAGFGRPDALAITQEHGTEPVQQAVALWRERFAGCPGPRSTRGWILKAIVGRWADGDAPQASPKRQPEQVDLLAAYRVLPGQERASVRAEAIALDSDSAAAWDIAEGKASALAVRLIERAMFRRIGGKHD